MKLNDQYSEVKNNINSDTVEFSIEASSKMFDILSSKIYEDPIRAIVRELCCNAIDANIDANNSEAIQVFLPTETKQTFMVKDTGIGMTNEDVMTVYKSYGKSTKSNSNKVIGALGLGGKTPFAYTNQFTLVTSKDGEKNSYIIFKGDDGIPNVTLVDTEKTDETGTIVEMIVKEEDITKFHLAAAKTFLFFHNMPIIERGFDQFYNIIYNHYFGKSLNRSEIVNETSKLYSQARTDLKKDYIHNDDKTAASVLIYKIMKSYNAENGIIMGQVFYSVNLEQLKNASDYKDNESNLVYNFPLGKYDSFCKIFHINIGAVSIQPSRESLSYNAATVKLLNKKFSSNFENFYKTVSENYNTAEAYLSNWEKIKYNKKIMMFDSSSYKSEKLQALHQLYKELPEFFLGDTFVSETAYLMKRKHNDVYALYNFAQNKSSFDYTKKELFESVFISGTLSKIFLNDDPKVSEKIINFLDKAIERNNSNFNIPSLLKQKIANHGTEKSFILDQKDIDSLIKYFNFEIIKLSEIKIEKEKKASTIKTEKLGVCYNYTNNYSPITPVDLLELAKKETVTYELFEGKPKVRGWYHTPLFNRCIVQPKGDKNNFLRLDHHGNWVAPRVETFMTIYRKLKNMGIILPTPKHFLVDWDFFKKHNIANKKNFKFIDHHLAEMLDKKIPNFEDLIRDTNVWTNTICDDRTAEIFLNAGKKYIGFSDTKLGKELNRIMIERKTAPTNLIERTEALNFVMNTILTRLTPQDFYIDNSVFERITIAYNKIVSDNKKSTPEKLDMQSVIYAEYPMLKYAFACSKDTSTFQDMAHYVAELEGLL